MEELTMTQAIVVSIPVVIIFSVSVAVFDTWYEDRMHKKGYCYNKGGWVKF